MHNAPSISGMRFNNEPRPSFPSESRTDDPVRIALVYFNAGGGHRAAATALKSQLASQHPSWEVSLVDLFAVLDPKQRFKQLTGFAPEAYYNKRLATGFTLGLTHELKLLQAMIRMSHQKIVAKLSDYWHVNQPNMVISLVPNFNRALADSVKANGKTLPFVTIMTDLADYAPNFWIEPGYTQHLICGSARAMSQAISQGIDAQSVHRISGMVLAPHFYQTATTDRSEARRKLGLNPDEVVGLVMFGGHGSAAMKRVALALSNRPLILLCGRNESLRKTLSRLPVKAKHHVVGFTDDVAQWMRVADYFIGKPGPGALSEAIHCGLPVIVTRNAWTMPQERWNTVWIEEQCVGQVLPSVTKVDVGVQAVIADLKSLRANVEKIQNRALFEVPLILEQILSENRTYQLTSQ